VGGDSTPYRGAGFLNTVEAYDPSTNSWTTKAPMPTARTSLAVGVVSGILYAVGGYNGYALTVVEAYDPKTNRWTTKASMPTALEGGSPAAGVVNGLLYVTNVGIVETYDPSRDAWTVLAPAPWQLFAQTGAVFNGIFYAIGGTGPAGGGEGAEGVAAYDPASNSWATKTHMPTGRGYLASGVINGLVYVVGGYDSNNGCTGRYANCDVFYRTAEAYSPSTDSWATAQPMPTSRAYLAAGVINGTLYAVGGWSCRWVIPRDGAPPARLVCVLLGTVEAFTP
jgi:N-acetylneuraminic acid mutarotase